MELDDSFMVSQRKSKSCKSMILNDEVSSNAIVRGRQSTSR